MEKKIIVAGGGHGGIAAASILAKRGYDVTVYEKNGRDSMGYDWTDIFDRKGLLAAGMDIPGEDKFNLKTDMTFFSPSLKTPLQQHVPEDQLEIQMERSDIYEHIITHAEKNGVKFEFNTVIEGPVLLGGRVVGIKTDKGSFFADLVIDAAGIDSPVRSNLPEYLGVQNKTKDYEQFYVYRGFYNKTGVSADYKFRVLLYYKGKPGIGWVADEEKHTDVLIGRFFPYDMDEVEATLKDLREDNPCLGTERVRGGQFVKIPVRQPLGLLVSDGYAAVGDSAFMTVPVIGSGIANSFKAARILANAVIADKNGAFTANTLWKYQKDFYKELGSGLAPLACVKLLLTRLEADEIDYIVDKGIINADDMTIGADATNLAAILGDVKPEDLMLKAKGVIADKALLKKILRLGKEMASVIAVCAAMPKNYDPKRVASWVKAYNKCFKH